MIKNVYIAALILIAGCQQSIVEDRAGADFNKKDPDDSDVVPPAPITGSFLVENRCGFKRKTAKGFESRCHLVNLAANGKEIKSESVPNNIRISWLNPTVLTGEGVNVSCVAENKNISQICQIETTTGSAKIEFTAKVVDTLASTERQLKDVLMLPYSVGVAAGLVMSLPSQFASEKDDKKDLGFQPLEFDSANAYIESNSFCATKNEIYYTNQRQRSFAMDGGGLTQVTLGEIYVSTNGKSTRYAGAPWGGSKSDLSHRLKISLGNRLFLSCFEGSLYASDSENFRILKFNDDSSVSEIINLENDALRPLRLAFDPLGRLHVLIAPKSINDNFFEPESKDVRVVGSDGKLTKIIPATGNFEVMKDIDFLNGNLVFSEPKKARIRSLNKSGELVTLAESLIEPTAIFVNSKNEVLFADGKEPAEGIPDNNYRYLKLLKNGIVSEVRSIFQRNVLDVGESSSAEHMALFNVGYYRDYIGVVKGAEVNAVIGDPLTVIATRDQPAKSARLGQPVSIKINKLGEIFYVDGDAAKLRKIDVNGILKTIGNIPLQQYAYPSHMGLTPAGDLIVSVTSAYPGRSKILRFTEAGNVSEVYLKENGNTKILGRLTALDVATNGDLYFVEDSKVYRVRNGTSVMQKIYERSLSMPLFNSLHVGKNEHIYLTDHYSVYDLFEGEMTRIAGTTYAGDTLEGVLAKDSKLSFVQGVAIDHKERMFIADGKNAKIRQLDVVSQNAPMKTFFGGKKETQMCGTGSLYNQAQKADLENAVQTSLSKMCAGEEVNVIGSFNGCNETNPADRVYRMAFAQLFEDAYNIIQIVTACD